MPTAIYVLTYTVTHNAHRLYHKNIHQRQFRLQYSLTLGYFNAFFEFTATFLTCVFCLLFKIFGLAQTFINLSKFIIKT